MRQVGDERRDRGRRRQRRGAARAAAASATPPNERQQQREPDEPELGQRLQLQRVGVLGELVDRALAQPLTRPAARADAVQRLGRERAQRHRPVVVAVALERRQARRAARQRASVPLVSCAPTTIASASPAQITRGGDQRRTPRQPQRARALAAAEHELREPPRPP